MDRCLACKHPAAILILWPSLWLGFTVDCFGGPLVWSQLIDGTAIPNLETSHVRGPGH